MCPSLPLSSYILPLFQSFLFKEMMSSLQRQPSTLLYDYLSVVPSNATSHQITHAFSRLPEKPGIVSATPPQAATIFLSSFLAKLLKYTLLILTFHHSSNSLASCPYDSLQLRTLTKHKSPGNHNLLTAQAPRTFPSSSSSTSL